MSRTHASELLRNALSAEFGEAAPEHAVTLLTAQWSLETDGGRHMYGHNFGGIKAAPGAPGQSFHTVEGHGASRREVNARFRVYPNAEAGARDYVHLLAKRYPAALTAARAGDTANFTNELARGGYFTADPQAYASGLAARVRAFESGAHEFAANHSIDTPLRAAALAALLRALNHENT